MQYQESDIEPYYMPAIQQQLQRYDEIKGEKNLNRLKKNLCEELQALGFNTWRKTLKEIQEMAALQNVIITVLDNKAQEGWVGKPKGIKPVLWEWGLLDPNVIYTSKVKNTNHEGKVP